MTKIFCDSCGKETDRNYVTSRLEFKMGRNHFEVIVATDNVWNKGDICARCLFKAISKASKKLLNPPITRKQ